MVVIKYAFRASRCPSCDQILFVRYKQRKRVPYSTDSVVVSLTENEFLEMLGFFILKLNEWKTSLGRIMAPEMNDRG